MISRVQGELTDEVISRIANTVAAWRGDGGTAEYADMAGYCRSVKLTEIAEHGHVLTPGRYVGAEAIGGVQDLVHEALGHGLLTALTAVADEPAQGEGGRATGLYLDRDLVGRATDAAGLDLEGRADVVEGALEGGDRVGARLVANAFEGAINDVLGDRLLAVEEDLVDQLGHQDAVVDGVDDQRPLGCGALARHYFFTFFAP